MAGKAKAKAKGKDKIKASQEPKCQPQVISKFTRKKNAAKEAGKEPWLDDLGQALAKSGLQIRKVEADGNCFFRACCDQMQGNESGHLLLRTEVVEFIREHPDDFVPYMEDEEDFSSYCKRMSKAGAWAGLHEQVAVTRLKGVMLCIHQAGQPCWTICPDFPEIPKDARAWHLSYHDGEHYNSVRLAEDYSDESAMPIKILPDGSLDAQRNSAAGSCWAQPSVDAVRWGTGCQSNSDILAALERSEGYTEKAIEDLVEQMARETLHGNDNPEVSVDQRISGKFCESPTKGDSPTKPLDSTAAAEPLPKPTVDSGNKSGVQEHGSEEADARQGRKLVTPVKDRLPARGRACVCGSGKKYKNCCGVHRGAAARRRKVEEARAADAKPGVAVPMSNLFI